MLIKAADARKTSNDFTNNSNKELIETLNRKITQASQKGEFRISYTGNISQSVFNLIKTAGYEISVSTDPRDHESFYTISWSRSECSPF